MLLMLGVVAKIEVFTCNAHCSPSPVSYRKCMVTSQRDVRLIWRFGEQETIKELSRSFLWGFML